MWVREGGREGREGGRGGGRGGGGGGGEGEREREGERDLLHVQQLFEQRTGKASSNTAFDLFNVCCTHTITQ